MKASELRIGNLVYGVSDRIETVIGLGEAAITAYAGDLVESQMTFPEEDFIPIPLTEEWLIGFGFTKVVYESDGTGYGTEYELECSHDVFMSYADDFSLGIYNSRKSSDDDFAVIPNWEQTKFVHGLQNLYYSLTGKELVCKPYKQL